MKKLSILFFIAFLTLSITHSYAQDVQEKVKTSQETEIAAKEKVTNKRIKVELDKIPNSILVSLRDSYAKYFVTQAYKASKANDIYYIELRKSRTIFTIAVDNNGRVLKELRDHNVLDQNTLANKN